MVEAASAHSFPVRVYYEDTDAAGIVYYANYLRFAERARTEMLRTIGIGQRNPEEEAGVSFAVRRCSVEYLAPARLDDMLEIRTRITGLSGAAIEAEQIVRCDANDLARLTVMLVCRDRRGRATRLPKTVREALNRFTESKQ